MGAQAPGHSGQHVGCGGRGHGRILVSEQVQQEGKYPVTVGKKPGMHGNKRKGVRVAEMFPERSQCVGGRGAAAAASHSSVRP